MNSAARGALAAGMLALLPACQEEPSFDERYSVAEEKIRDKAAEMDRALIEAERKRMAPQQQAPVQDQRKDEPSTT